MNQSTGNELTAVCGPAPDRTLTGRLHSCYLRRTGVRAAQNGGHENSYR